MQHVSQQNMTCLACKLQTTSIQKCYILGGPQLYKLYYTDSPALTRHITRLLQEVNEPKQKSTQIKFNHLQD